MYTFKGVTYRPAVIKDIPSLAYFLTNITRENELVGLLEHNMVTGSVVLRDLIKENQGVTIIAEKDDKIVGCMILGKSTLWWSPTEFFTNLAFYVDPDYRKNYRIQDKLIEAAKNLADATKTPLLLQLIDATDKKLKALKYLNHKGFKTIGVDGVYLPPK
jgi:N-acetylglutamate synthase-like GNAT family acetyltransferase